MPTGAENEIPRRATYLNLTSISSSRTVKTVSTLLHMLLQSLITNIVEYAATVADRKRLVFATSPLLTSVAQSNFGGVHT